MTIWLKQSTASQEIPLGYFLDSTDGDTEETGLTISNTDIKIWKTGATTLANKNSGGATHISNGIYYCTLDATDTNTLGPMVVFVHESGALTVRVECLVLAANVYDSLVGGTDYLEVDAVAISGDTTAANNAELAFDGTGFGFTNCTMPTVTTLTGHTAQTGDNYARLGAPAGASVSADIAAAKSDTAAILVDTGTSGVLLASTATSAGLVDAIWDEPAAGHIAAGSFGAQCGTDIDAILADTNELQGNQGNWATATVVDLNADQSAVTVGTVTTLTGHTAQTGDNYARLGAPAGVSIAADIAAIEAQTDDIGAAGAGLTAVPWNAAWDAEVQSEVADALAVYDPPTRAEATSDTNSILAKLLAYFQLAMRSDAAIATDNATELTAINADGGSGAGDFSNQAEALEALRDQGDAAWATATSVTVSDKTGFSLAADQSGVTVGTVNTLTGHTAQTGDSYAYLGTNLGALGANASEAGGTGDHLTAIPWNAAWDAEVQSEATDALNAYDPPTRAEATSDANSILAKLLAYFQLALRSDAAIATDNATELTALNADGGSGAGDFSNQTDAGEALRDRGDAAWATATSVTVSDKTGFSLAADQSGVTIGTVSTLTGHTAQTGDSFARLGAPAGASVSADVAAVKTQAAAIETDTQAIEADTQNIQSRLPAALVSGRMSSDAVAISGSTAAADNIEATAEVIVTGSAAAGTLSTTQMSTDLSEATNDHYIGRIITWTSGPLLGQSSDITDYVATNGVLTFTATTEAPVAGNTFVIT